MERSRPCFSIIGFVFCLSLLLFISCQSNNSPIESLRKKIENEFASCEGTFAMAWKDLQTGEEIRINGDTIFHAASTMKTPVMIEVYKQAAAGRFSLGDSLLIKNEFYSIVDSSVFQLSAEDDSENKLYSQIGMKRSIGDLVYDMIISSSNLATNIIIGLVDAREVTLTMTSLGAENLKVLRGVEDLMAFRRGLSNVTTANDLLLIYELLANGQLVDGQSNQEMISILLDQSFNDVIPALLPEDVRVAHKTGSITGVHHDSGIVFLSDGRKYVLVLLSKDLKDFTKGTATLSKVSKILYDYVVTK